MVRLKTCKVCKTKFQPTRPIQPCCGYECSVTYGIAVASKNTARKAREAAKAHREAKVKAKTKAQWMKEAQAAFNSWIRKRDEALPCISCGRMHNGQYHAGHYRTTKAAPELRFNEFNNNKQCSVCNNHLSGNIVEYRKGLLAKYGLMVVEYLEGKHDPKHYTIDDLKAIKKEYTDRLKMLDTRQTVN